MSLSNTSLFLVVVSLFQLLMMQAHSHQTFSISKFEPGSDGLTYERDAFVRPGGRQLNLIAFTNSSSSYPRALSVGRVLYSDPIKLWDGDQQESFRCSVTFNIFGVDTNPADGMTFFMVPVNSTTPTGGEGGSLGIYDAVKPGSPVFAVEFDVYSNPWDPSFRHVGININSRASVETASIESAIGRIVVKANIRYSALGKRISVEVSRGLYNEDFVAEISYDYDLSTLLPQHVQIGISASTGTQHVATFDVLAWSFFTFSEYDHQNGLHQY